MLQDVLQLTEPGVAHSEMQTNTLYEKEVYFSIIMIEGKDSPLILKTKYAQK